MTEIVGNKKYICNDFGYYHTHKQVDDVLRYVCCCLCK